MGYMISLSGRFPDDVAEQRQLELLADFEMLREKYEAAQGSVYLDLQAEPVISFPHEEHEPVDPATAGQPPARGASYRRGSS